MSDAKKKKRIRELNDLLRTTMMSQFGKVTMTQGIAGLEDHHREEAITKIREFRDFDIENDPHNEHDFGAVTVSSYLQIFWKIDYYDKTMEMGSEDPSDPKKTTRVLTIMLASEY
jgi:hypothetical protein